MLWVLVIGAAGADELPASRSASAAVISADLISAEDGVARGTGSVRIALGTQVAEGARFELDLEAGQLILEDGVWHRPEGDLQFQHATIDLGDASCFHRGVDDRCRCDGVGLWLSGGNPADLGRYRANRERRTRRGRSIYRGLDPGV